MKLLMVIPAYNEEDNIVGVVNTIKEKYPEYDYIVVNDGSTDHTSRRCHKHGFEIIDLPVNLGLAGAFQTGLKYAYYKTMTVYCSLMRMDSTSLNILRLCLKKWNRDMIL